MPPATELWTEDEGMGVNRRLEDPAGDYVPPLDEMVVEMGTAPIAEVTDDWDATDWQARHDMMDQAVRDQQPVPERRHCYNCGRWVNYRPEEGESDPRCPKCSWQQCICGACGCNRHSIGRRQHD